MLIAIENSNVSNQERRLTEPTFHRNRYQEQRHLPPRALQESVGILESRSDRET